MDICFNYKRRKLFIIALSLVLAMTLLSACHTKEADSLEIGSMPTFSAVIYAVGIERGFFDEAGINVNLTIFRSAIERDAAATSGNLDGFMTDIMGAINLYKSDVPFIMTSKEYENFSVMAHSDVDMDQSPMSIGMSNNTLIEFIVDMYMSASNEKVHIAKLPDRMAALLSQEIELGVFPEPFTSIIMGRGGSKVFSTSDKGIQPVVMVFDEQLIEENSAIIKAFYEGYEQSVTYIKETDYNLYKDILVVYGLATEDTVDKLKLPINQYALRSVNEADYDLIVEWMMTKGLLDADIDFNLISTNKYSLK